MYFWTTQHVNFYLVEMNFIMSESSLKISMPLPWLAAAGFTNQMLFAQCFIGVLSLGQYPFDKSL